MNVVCPDLGCKHRAKAVPPIPHRLVTDADAPFVEQASTCLRESGNPTYIITASRMISGDVLEYLKGFLILRTWKACSLHSIPFPLTRPVVWLIAICATGCTIGRLGKRVYKSP